MTGRDYWTDGLTWACNSAMFVFGVVLALLGALLPILLENWQLEPARAGSLFLFLNAGAFFITLIGGPSFDRFGYRRILVACSVTAAAAFFVIAGVRGFAGLALASFLLGAGGGGLNAGTNALVSDLYPDSRGAALNRLGIFFGFGAFSIPLLIGSLTDVWGLNVILIITGVACLLPGLLLLSSSMPPAKHAAGFPVGSAVEALKSPLVLLFGLLLFFHSGNEISTSGWMTTYLVSQLPLTPQRASLYLAAFWASVMIGRLVAARLLHYFSESRLVQLAALASALSVGLLVWWPDLRLSAVFACTTGVCISAIFPSVLGQATGRFPALSGTVMGVLICIALIGGMLIPWLAGLLVAVLGPGAGLYLPIVGLLAVFVIQTVIRYLYS